MNRPPSASHPTSAFHVRYVCGVMETAGLNYEYMTVDRYRQALKTEPESIATSPEHMPWRRVHCGSGCAGKIPARDAHFAQGNPQALIRSLPQGTPALLGGWAIRGWKQQGWTPLRPNLFLALQDTDATLHHFLERGEWKHQRRTPEQWTKWAQAGAASKAVADHPDLETEHRAGPLTYEVEVYQVRPVQTRVQVLH